VTDTATTTTTGVRPAPPRHWARTAILLALVLGFLWAGAASNIELSDLLRGPRVLLRIADRMFVWPEWSYAGRAFTTMLESIQIAWIGTIIAAIFSLPLGVLGAVNLTGSIGSNIVRQILNGFRAVPELILAVVLVAMLGLGALPGALAIGIHSIGTLGKLTAEVVEGIDTGPVEAAEAVGASRWKLIRWGVMPQVMPDVMAFWLYRFEINVRASAVLGLIGAGGVGSTLQQAIVYKEFGKAGITILVIIAATIVIDTISAAIRRRIISGGRPRGDEARQPEVVEAM
jgi:phosphonate transport system permease protein